MIVLHHVKNIWRFNLHLCIIMLPKVDIFQAFVGAFAIFGISTFSAQFLYKAGKTIDFLAHVPFYKGEAIINFYQ